MAKCSLCGRKAGFMMSMCAACIRQNQQEVSTRVATRAAHHEQAQAELARRADAVILTTAPALEGYRVLETVDVVAAEYAAGTSALVALVAGLADIGATSLDVQGKLGEGRRACLAGLKREAHLRGANAVVAVEIDYGGFGANGREVVLVAATGTAVRVEPAARDEPRARYETALALVSGTGPGEYDRF